MLVFSSVLLQAPLNRLMQVITFCIMVTVHELKEIPVCLFEMRSLSAVLKCTVNLFSGSFYVENGCTRGRHILFYLYFFSYESKAGVYDHLV